MLLFLPFRVCVSVYACFLDLLRWTAGSLSLYRTRDKLFIGSKVQCVFCFKICTPEGRGEQREGVQISKQSTQNLTLEYLEPCVCCLFFRCVKWPGWATACGSPSGWTPPCGCTTRTRSSTCRTSTSSPTSARCSVRIKINTGYTEFGHEVLLNIFFVRRLTDFGKGSAKLKVAVSCFPCEMPGNPFYPHKP